MTFIFSLPEAEGMWKYNISLFGGNAGTFPGKGGGLKLDLFQGSAFVGNVYCWKSWNVDSSKISFISDNLHNFIICTLSRLKFHKILGTFWHGLIPN